MSVSASSTAACARTQALLTRLSTQLCQTYRDETRDHRSNDDQQSPPHIVISFLLPESPRFNFITQPTKRCLPLQFISEAVAAERFAEFFHAAAFELSAPGGFHFRFGHPRSLIPSWTGPQRFCCIAHTSQDRPARERCCCNSDGSLVMLAAIRRAPSRYLARRGGPTT